MKAIICGEVIAESSRTYEVDGCVYFPRHAVREELLEQSTLSTFCPSKKGQAHYWNVLAGEERVPNAVFSYDRLGGGYSHIEGWVGVHTRPGDDRIVIVH